MKKALRTNEEETSARHGDQARNDSEKRLPLVVLWFIIEKS